MFMPYRIRHCLFVVKIKKKEVQLSHREGVQNGGRGVFFDFLGYHKLRRNRFYEVQRCSGYYRHYPHRRHCTWFNGGVLLPLVVPPAQNIADQGWPIPKTPF
jgi:hypothetical protein